MFMLILAAAVAAPTAKAPATAPLTTADAADGRCVALLGYLGSHGSPEEAAATQRIIPYFLGRLSARHPATAIAGIVRRAADDARAKNLDADTEGEHCQAMFRINTKAFVAGVRGTAPAAPEPAQP